MTESGAAEPAGVAPGKSLARHSTVMAAGTATSRFLGFIRATLMIAAIGATTGVADAFDAANKIPSILYALIASGVLNAVLVPQIVRAFARKGGKRSVDRILTLGGTLVFAISIVFTSLATLAIAVVYHEDSPALVALAVAFAFWCIPQLFFYGMYTLLGQVLNSREQFGPYMWAPVANNIVGIAGLLAYLAIFGQHAGGADVDIAQTWTAGRIALLAGVATLGIAVQATVLIIPLVRGGYRWRWKWRGPKGELDGVKRVAGWALAAVLLEQVGIAWTVRIASGARGAADALDYVGDIAGNAVYSYALVIYLVPHSLVTVSIVTALFTGMSRFAAAGDMAGLRGELSRGLRTIAIFTVFSTVALVVLAPLAVRVIYPSATTEEVATIASVLTAMSLGLVALGAMVLIKMVYFALEDGRSIFFIHIPMTITLVGVSLIGQATLHPRWWVVGIAAGLAASNVVAMALRMAGLQRKLGGIDGRRVARTHVLAIVAAVPAGAAGWLLVQAAPNLADSSRLAAVGLAASWCAGIGIAMLALYSIALWALRVSEWRDAAAPILRKLGIRVT